MQNDVTFLFDTTRMQLAPCNDIHEKLNKIEQPFLTTSIPANTFWPPLYWSSPIPNCVSRIHWKGLMVLFALSEDGCPNAQIKPRWQQIKVIETANENVQKQKLLGSTNKCFHSVCFRVPFEEAEKLFKRIC